MTTQQTQTPAAWYADPVIENQLRHFDGSSWTEHIAPAGPVGRPHNPQLRLTWPLIVPGQPPEQRHWRSDEQLPSAHEWPG
jgi:hypothetical protein